MSHTTKDTFSNRNTNVDLPLTQDLFVSGTTSGDTGHPLVYHPVTKKMSLGEFPAGESILDFGRTGSTLAIITDKATFALDLNQKTYASQVELLRDTGFDNPANGSDWQVNTAAWTIANSAAYSSNNLGGYLYQDVQGNTAGNFTATVVVDSVAQGGAHLIIGAFTSPPITAPGTYSYTFTQPAGPLRFHIQALTGAYGFTGNISEAHLYQNGVLLQDAYDGDFVHKTGAETIPGQKNFTGGLDATTYQFQGRPLATFSTITGNNYPILTFGSTDWHTIRTESNYFEWYTPGTARGMQLDNSGNLHVDSAIDTPEYRSLGNKILSYANGAGGLGTLTVGWYGGVGVINNVGVSHQWTLAGSGSQGMALDPGANLTVAGNVQAQKFIGDGSLLTNLPQATVNDSNYAKLNSGNTFTQAQTISQNGDTLTVSAGGFSRVSATNFLSLLQWDNDNNLNLAGSKLKLGYNPSDPDDAVNKAYVDQMAGTQIANSPVFTATADGAQTIPLGAAATGLVSVTCLEAGGYFTKTIWEPYCSILGSNLQITTDAGLRTGDKILAKYYA